MQQGRGLLRIPQERGQFGLPALQSFDLRLELEGRDAGQDRIDGLVQFALGALQLAALGAEFGATLDPQPVHLACEFGTELAQQLRLHQVRAQPVQDRDFQRVAMDVDPVVAGPLVPRRGAAEQVFRDHCVAATAAATLHQAGKQVLRSTPLVERVLSAVSARETD
nr:hypothetical protein [Methylobacterium sp. UNC300MFChir4.1]